MERSQYPVHPTMLPGGPSGDGPLSALIPSHTVHGTRKHGHVDPTSTASPTSSALTATSTHATPNPTHDPDLRTSTSHHNNTITLSKPLFISLMTTSGTLFIFSLLTIFVLSYRNLKAHRARKSAEQWGRQTRFWGAQDRFLDHHHRHAQDPNNEDEQSRSPIRAQQKLQRQPTDPNLKPLPRDPPPLQSHRRVSAMSKAIDDSFRARYTGVLMPVLPENPEMIEVETGKVEIEGSPVAFEVWGHRRLEGPAVHEVPNVPAGARERALEEYGRLARMGQVVRSDDLREVVVADRRRRGRVMSLFFDQGVGFWVARK